MPFTFLWIRQNADFSEVFSFCDSSPIEDIGKYQQIEKAAELGEFWAPLKKISIKSVA